MLKFYVDNNLRILSKEIPLEIVQYSEEDVEVYSTFNTTNNTFTFTFIRPDGYKANEVYFAWQGVVDGFNK